MEIMGFGMKRRKWILPCLNSASISILVNRSPTNKFKLERGVRKGDPLSPFLFILAAEGLNLLVKSAVRNKMYNGVEIGRDKIPISHLQYADDTIINVNVDLVEVEAMACLVVCKVGKFPCTYLGLPIGSNMNKMERWKLVVAKFEKMLTDWKACSISFGRRLTLVKSVLNSFPFEVLLPFEEGGLNLRDLKSKNLALIGKWWWRFKVLKPPHYGLGAAIDALGEPFSNLFCRLIGNGNNTSFWNDKWLEGEAL
ncbi:uncharacterized protein [Rutidosis leptorrhynchoides]|uniref:uncharacterized protein n=1 Tax=Rutidosis leptorrhynchoides TaxID=125765 RepID=UPI003A993ED5